MVQEERTAERARPRPGEREREKKDEPALTRYLIRVNPKNQAELERMLVKAGAEAIAPNDDDD